MKPKQARVSAHKDFSSFSKKGTRAFSGVFRRAFACFHSIYLAHDYFLLIACIVVFFDEV